MVIKTASVILSVEVLLLFLLLMTVASCRRKTPPPPVAKIIPHQDTVHGEVRKDNYTWLRDRDNPDVIAYLEAENEYTEEMMAHTGELQETLYQEMVSRIKETDLDVPERIDNTYYYTRTEEGKQYPIYCRKQGSLEAEEEVILDQNALAEGREFLKLGVVKISPNHQLLAFSIDTTGSETYTIHVKDLTTGRLLDDEIPNTYYSVQWANDNQTLYYNVLNEARRPFQLYKHRLGSKQNEDELVHFEEDDSYYLYLTKTRSRKYLLLQLESNTTTETWYLDADTPDADFRLIHPRQHKMEYDVEHHSDRFYIVTNDNAKNFKLMQAPVNAPAKKNWREVLPHRESVKIDGVDAFKEHLVVYEREDGLKQIRVTDLRTDKVHYIEFPEPVYTFGAGRNPEFSTSTLRFTYTSLVTPRSVFDYDMTTGDRELKKQYEVLGGYQPETYQSERIFAAAADGARVPISLVYKEGLRRDGRNPCYLYGYGSYGASMDPGFDSKRLSLLDRGFVFAIAHVRGGGEMGRQWYEDGKLLKKMNTFTDFISCAEYLITEKYTSPDKLAIAGGSAGGLLMGAVVNMRPDLFEAVVAKVPFVDVINTMLDETIPLTVIEYEEWGNPNEREYYDYMKRYSPYDNVEAKAYPHMLITAGLNDPRVQYWEPAKWTAKLRALKTDDNLLLLKTNMGAGHSGKSGRYDYLKDVAFEYAFVIDVVYKD